MNRYRITVDVEAVTGHGVTLSQATDALRQHGLNVQGARLVYVPAGEPGVLELPVPHPGFVEQDSAGADRHGVPGGPTDIHAEARRQGAFSSLQRGEGA